MENTNKALAKLKDTTPSGPKPMHWNLKMGKDVLKDPFGDGKLKMTKVK